MLFYTIFLVAMFTAIVLIPPLTFIYQKLNIVDIPSPRKVHTKPIPRVGGVAIVIATIIPIIGWMQLDDPVIGLLAGIVVLFILGVFDDAKNLTYKIKFLFQIVSILLVFVFGFIDVQSSHFVVNELLSGLIVLVAYFLFILGVTNAINLSDGLDGLAGGEALLSFSIIGLLAYESTNTSIILIVLAIIGAVFGFLRFNTYPAKIFMGDTGSLFLGFILGLLSVALTYRADYAYAKLLPLLLVGLPVLDTLMVMVIRIYNSQSPFNADRNHLHHRLLDHGFEHYQSVLIIYLIQSIFVLTAYFMRYDTELNIIIAFMIISFFAILLSYITRKKSNTKTFDSSLLERISMWLKSIVNSHTEKLFTLLAALLILYALTSSLSMQKFDIDVLILLSAIFIVGVIGLILFRRKPSNWIERIAIHIMIVLSIYFGANSDSSNVFEGFQMVMLLLCVFVIVVLFAGEGRKKFIGSPLDFLLVATAIVIPNLPDSPISDHGLSFLIMKLIILFYCVEYVLFNIVKNWWVIRSTLIVSAFIPITLNYL
ncbi:MAG: MraY family glycosyltransferase [Gammaproteobacteria bacterium]|nr:MraY family glycosyltransferase [Gammaproteobacteria bacterium]